MALTLEERLSIEADIEHLYAAVLPKTAGEHDQVRRYIDVGEYALALDDLADIWLEWKKPVPPTVRGLFDELATKMGMRYGDEWRAVAEILSAK
jgi:hypothetical protein